MTDDPKKLLPLADSLSNLAAGVAKQIADQNKALMGGLNLPKSPTIEVPKFHIPDMVNPNLASEFHKRLVQMIKSFDESLDAGHEVGVRLASFGQAITIHLGSVGFWNPSLLIFHGTTEQGDPVELIQHISQISILLIKVKRSDTSKPKRPIGFVWGDESDAPASGA